MNRGFFKITSLILILVMLLPGRTVSAASSLRFDHQTGDGGQFFPLARADGSVTGVLSIHWGDPQGKQGAPRTDFLLTPDAGAAITLEMGERLPMPVSALAALSGKRIMVQGRWLEAFSRSPKFQVAAISPSEAEGQNNHSGADALIVSGPQPWVSVLCKFNDIADEPKMPAYFANMYSSSYPGLDHYWREVSYSQISVSGSRSTAGWYTLPQPRSYYVYERDKDGNLELDFNRITADCLGTADTEIDYTQYVGINMMFNSDLDGYAWGGGHLLTLDGENRVWHTTWEPPWGYKDLAVIEHEMGHGFGLPHSSGQYGAIYDNQWDVMSDHWSNCDRLRDAMYGCLGQQTIAYHRSIEGWIPTGRTAVVPTGSQTTLTLEPLEKFSTGGFLMAQVPVNYSTTNFYTLEVRRKIGYDVRLPGEAVIIHRVDTSSDRPARVVDSDGNGNTGDEGAQWQAGEVFSDPANDINVSILSTTPSGGYVISIVNGDQAAPCPELINYWKGEYWSNPDLSGNSSLCRDDFTVNFNWGDAAPDPILPADGFSARWTRTFEFAEDTYRFWLNHDDGARLYIDDMNLPILDAWDTRDRWDFVNVPLSAGAHTIRLAMHDDSGTAKNHLFWEPYQVHGWRGEYFNSPDPGTPALIRDDAEINFDWGTGSPDPLIRPDQFSARWTRRIMFDQGTYIFQANHNDGARLFVDGQMVIDNWCSECQQSDTLALQMTPGEHPVVFETWDNQGLSSAQLNISLLDVYEPDAVPGAAKAILPGVSQTRSISPVGDFDYVTFTLAQPSGIVLETSGQTDSDTELWLFDSSMNQIASNDDNGTNFYSRIALGCDAAPLAPGTYFAKVNDYNDNHPIPAYHLSLALTPCPDLVINSLVTTPAQPQIGQPVGYTAVLYNQGALDIAVPFRVNLYIDGSPTACGQPGSYAWDVSSLAAGASTTLVYSGPALDSAGPHSVTAVADSQCSITESDENNNAAAVAFSLLPGSFSRLSPANGDIAVSITPVLSWNAAPGALGYEYCLDNNTENPCPKGWTPSMDTSVSLNALMFDTTYYWHVRAVNAGGSAPSDGGWWRFTTQSMPAQCRPTWKLDISVQDGGGASAVTIGQGAAYTDGLDTLCGEKPLAPTPSTGVFDARLVLPGGAQATLADFRAGGLDTIEWVIQSQSGPGGGPLTFTWDPAVLPRLGTFRLSGDQVSLDMRAANQLVLQPGPLATSMLKITLNTQPLGQPVFLPAITR